MLAIDVQRIPSKQQWSAMNTNGRSADIKPPEGNLIPGIVTMHQCRRTSGLVADRIIRFRGACWPRNVHRSTELRLADAFTRRNTPGHDRQHDVDDVLHGNVGDVRAVPASPA